MNPQFPSVGDVFQDKTEPKAKNKVLATLPMHRNLIEISFENGEKMYASSISADALDGHDFPQENAEAILKLYQEFAEKYIQLARI